MASWTDNKIPTFNPYVQQMPVEAMVSVGAEKQRRYDEGVQKIQTQIDNIAGLDVIRDIDKKYLQSKLNTVGNNLRTVAAGDFSSYQLVNSTSGMINQIARDPIVQNSVMSTQKVRKSLNDKETANKNGKGSVENDWWLDKDINSYINNPDQKASFSGGYIEYRDIKPKMLDVLKSLHESGKDEDVPWVVDPITREVNYAETADVMVQKGWKGITSGQIENAIRASFDQNDLRQMHISGQYQFKDYTPDDLKKDAMLEYETGMTYANRQIADLKKFAELNTGNKNKYNQAMASIKEWETQIGTEGDYQNKLKAKLSSTLALIDANPDAAKAEIYKNATVKQFAISHAWEETATKYVNNPFETVKQWKLRYGLDVAKFNYEQEQDKFLNGIASAELQLKIDKQSGGAGFRSTLGIPQSEISITNRLDNDIKKYGDDADALSAQLAADIRRKLIAGGMKAEDIKITEDDIDKIIKEQYTGPFSSGIGPEMKGQIRQIQSMRREFGKYNTVKRVAMDIADNNPEVMQIKKELLTDLQSHSSLALNLNGRAVIYSPEELVNTLSKYRRLPVVRNAQGGTDRDLSSLSNKEKELVQNYPMNNIATEYQDFIDKNDDRLKKYNTVLEAEIGKRTPEYVTKGITLGTTSEQKARYYGALGQVMDRIGNDKGNYPGVDTDEIQGWMTDEKSKADLRYGIQQDGENTWLVVGFGTKSQKLKLEGDEASYFPEARRTVEASIKNDFISMQGTTNVMGGKPEGARWQRLPKLKRIVAYGDAIADHTDDNITYANLKVATSEGEMMIEFRLGNDVLPFSPVNIDALYNNITDEEIERQFKIEYPHFKGSLYPQ